MYEITHFNMQIHKYTYHHFYETASNIYWCRSYLNWNLVSIKLSQTGESSLFYARNRDACLEHVFAWDGRYNSNTRIGLFYKRKSVSIWKSRSLDKASCCRYDTCIRDKCMETRLNRSDRLIKMYVIDDPYVKDDYMHLW